MGKTKIKNLLKNGLKEIDFSEYPFGKIREVLEELDYKLGDRPYHNQFQELSDGTNGGEIDYGVYVYKNNQYTGYMLTGSFGYGNCHLIKYDVSNKSN